MADHIYVQIDNKGESVVLATRDTAVIFKHQERMDAKKVRRVVSQLQSKLPDAEVHTTYFDGGKRDRKKRRNVREWEQGWKQIEADKDTHLQLSIDNELIKEGDSVPEVHDVRPTALVKDLSDVKRSDAD